MSWRARVQTPIWSPDLVKEHVAKAHALARPVGGGAGPKERGEAALARVCEAQMRRGAACKAEGRHTRGGGGAS